MSGKILVVLGPEDTASSKSFRNLVGVSTITHDQLNTYDVLVHDFLVFTKASFEAACEARPAPEARKTARTDKMLAAAVAAPAASDDHAEDTAQAMAASEEEE